MGSYASVAVRDAQGNIVGYQSTSTGQIVETTGAASPAFQQAQSEYSAQRYNVVGSSPTYQQQSVPVTQTPSYYDTSTAAGIAAQVGATGGYTGTDLQGIAKQQGYQGPVFISPVENRSTVPTRDLSSNAPTRIEVLQGYTNYEQQALAGVQFRPGFTPPQSLGDSRTQAALQGAAAMRMMGMTVASEDVMLGRTLEAQRQAAFGTPGSTDDRFYSGEYQKWVQNKIELPSTYHHIGMRAGVPIPANRWEYQGDLAVELLKGSPRKDSEVFSPVSGEMSKYLPQFGGRGEGVQDYAWRLSQEGTLGAGPVSYSAATEKLLSAEGKYGPYGELWGGKIDTPTTDVFPTSFTPVGAAEPTLTPTTQSAQVLASMEAAGYSVEQATPSTTQVKGVGAAFLPKSAKGVEAGMAMGAMQKPFKSPETTTVFEQPTGELLGYNVPFISPAVAFFQPGKEIITNERITAIPETTTLKGTTQEQVSGGVLTTQTYETTGGSQKDTTSVERGTPSGFERLISPITTPYKSLEKTIGGAIPISPEQGEEMVRLHTLTNPMTMHYALPGYIAEYAATPVSKAIGVPVSEDIVLGTRMFEPLKGQFTAFKEAPLLTGTSYVIGAGFGAGAKVLGSAYNTIARVPLAEAAISKGGSYRTAMQYSDVLTTKAIPVVLGAMYVTDVSYRSTRGFSEFGVSSYERAKVIGLQEAAPMTIGAIRGYNAPTSIYNAARTSDIGYKSAVQEGTATGRFDYYVKQPATRPIELVKQDYRAYVQENTATLTPQQKIAKDILDIQSTLKHGDNEQMFFYSEISGNRLGKVEGISSSEILGKDVVAERMRINQQVPSEEYLIAIHTHPPESKISNLKTVGARLSDGYGKMLQGEITPVQLIKGIPRVVGETFGNKYTTPSANDILALRSSASSGVAAEGIVSSSKVAMYKTDVGGENTPSGIYKAYAKAIEIYPSSKAEVEFMRTGKGLGFEPSLYTRGELKATLPKEPNVFNYAVERTGFNKAPTPEPQTLKYSSEPAPGISTGRSVTEPYASSIVSKAYGEQTVGVDYFTKGTYSEPTTIKQGQYFTKDFEPTTFEPSTEGAYGKPKTLFDVVINKANQPISPEPTRKFFTEKTSNQLSSKAYPEASETTGMKIKAYLQETPNLGKDIKTWFRNPKQEISDYNRMYELNKKFGGTTGGDAAGSTTQKVTPFGAAPSGRIGTKTVGGKTVGGLTPERSLQSQGISEPPLPSGRRGFVESHSVDFRGSPASKTMKPMGEKAQGTKQASGQFQIMSEQLPMVEGMTTSRVAPRQTPNAYPFSIQMPRSAEFDVAQSTKVSREVVFAPQLQEVQSFSGTTPLQSQVSEVSQRQMRDQAASLISDIGRTSRQSVAQERASAFGRISGRVFEPAQTRVPRIGSGTTILPMSDVGYTSDIIPTQRTSQTQTQEIITSIERFPPTQLPPVIPVIPDFGGAGGSGGGVKRGKRKFREIFNVGLDLSTFGPKAFDWGGGPAGGAARKTKSRPKKATIKQLVKRATTKRGKK